MKIVGDVLSVVSEQREFLGKDGVKAVRRVSHVVLLTKEDDINVVSNVTSYDDSFELPKMGAKGWVSPRVKKYENFKGTIAEVLV